MRVLVVSTPGLGHITPLLPVARALRDAGHRVEWATPAEAHPTLHAAGFTAHPVGMGLAERGRRLPELAPELPDLPPRSRRPVVFSTLFARLAAPATAAGLDPLVDAFAPDLVVHEAAELASAPVATARGIPHVTVGFGGAIPDGVVAAAADAIAPEWTQRGLDPPVALGLYDHAYLHPFPPAFGARPTAPTVVPLRPTDHEADPAPAPSWCASLGRVRPLVYVTFGTEFAPAAPWRPIVEGLGGLAVDAVCTVSRAVDPAALGVVPRNVRVERFVPQHHLLARASLVVSHGGSGSVLGAAAAGVRQIAVPIAADQFDNAAAIVGAGVGTALDAPTVTAASLAVAVAQTLDDPAVAAATAAVTAEIAAMPSAADVVPRLVALGRPG